MPCCLGGSQDLGPGNTYYDAMSLLTDLAMQQHDETGEVFPIHYTCLGWEAAAIKFSNDLYILSAPLLPLISMLLLPGRALP